VIENAMPTTVNKQRVFQQLTTLLSKNGKSAEPENRPVLEQFLYAICREGVTRELAERAYRNLREQYFDWNEVRVSSPRELAESMACLPDAENRGQRVIDFLQEVFETTFSFDLESLQKKGLKQAAKQLSRYQAANDYAVASVIQQSLGGHAIPLDNAAVRVLRRLAVIESEAEDLETLRGSLEHQIPKAKGPAFCDAVSAIAYEVCLEDEPRCAACPLCPHCPTGLELKNSPVAAETSHRTKPR
jgi:endonuclease III